MRARWWIAVLSAAAVLAQAVPASASGIKARFGRGAKKNQEQIRACVQKRAWMAYFQDDEGGLSPVRDTLNTDNDEDWIGLRFTDYDGPRVRLGVLKVINKSAESEEEDWSGKIEVPISGIQEMLTVALYNTKRSTSSSRSASTRSKPSRPGKTSWSPARPRSSTSGKSSARSTWSARRSPRECRYRAGLHPELCRSRDL